MALKIACAVLGLLHMLSALPSTDKANTLDDLMMVDDTLAVASYIRETRAAASRKNEGEFDKSSESEADGEVGYSRKKSGGGKRGYQHFDAYHKKAGDHYEFEKQDSYGLEDKGQDGAYSHNHERRANPENSEEDERPKNKQKQRKEKDDREDHKDVEHEELKEGEGDGNGDGNGAVEASGHDPNDYKLPERYTYGDDDEEFKF